MISHRQVPRMPEELPGRSRPSFLPGVNCQSGADGDSFHLFRRANDGNRGMSVGPAVGAAAGTAATTVVLRNQPPQFPSVPPSQ